ncbi:MAG: hypothetical protein M0037_05725 [Betaproteobacteria bacterium]|nr:hypothetical protein [Betaproteobacteria bacterium]
MSNGVLKTIAIVGLTYWLGLMAPVAHAVDFDGTGDGGDIELPPAPPTPPATCVGNCGGGYVNPAYAAAMRAMAAQRAEQQREYEERMYHQEVSQANTIYQQSHEAELDHNYTLAIQLDEQQLNYEENAKYTNFHLGRVRANINIDKADLASSEGNYAAALAYMNDIDDGYLNEADRQFIVRLKEVIEKQREMALAQQESTAFVAQENADLARQARENAAQEEALATERANAQLQEFDSVGNKLPPSVKALTLSSVAITTNAFGIKSNPDKPGLEARSQVTAGDTGAMDQAKRMLGSSQAAVGNASNEDAAANASVTADSGGGTEATVAAPPSTPTALPESVLENKDYQAAAAKLQSDQSKQDAIQHTIDQLQIQQAAAQNDADKSTIQIQIYKMSGELSQAKGQVKIDQNAVDDVVKVIEGSPIMKPAPQESHQGRQ